MGFKQSFFDIHKDIDGNILKPGDKVLWSEHVDSYYVSDRVAYLRKMTVTDADWRSLRIEGKSEYVEVYNSHKTILKYDWT